MVAWQSLLSGMGWGENTVSVDGLYSHSWTSAIVPILMWPSLVKQLRVSEELASAADGTGVTFVPVDEWERSGM